MKSVKFVDFTVMYMFGSGSLEDPYQVQTVDDLLTIEEYPSAVFSLQSDIDCSEIDTSIDNFSGVLYGNGNTILNLTTGLFKRLRGTVESVIFSDCWVESNQNTGIVSTNAGIIKDCRVVNSRIIGKKLVGGIAATLRSGCVIQDCTVNNTVIKSQENLAGGIVGKSGRNSSIIDSSISESILSSKVRAGGVCGEVKKSYINAVTAENVTVTTDEGIAGGLFGRQLIDSNIENVTLRDCMISSSNMFSTGIAGLIEGSYLEDCLIDSVNADYITACEVVQSGWNQMSLRNMSVEQPVFQVISPIRRLANQFEVDYPVSSGNADLLAVFETDETVVELYANNRVVHDYGETKSVITIESDIKKVIDKLLSSGEEVTLTHLSDEILREKARSNL